MSVVNDFTLTDRAANVDSAFVGTCPPPTSSLGRSVTSHGNVLWSLGHGNGAWTRTFDDPISIVSESSDASLIATVTVGRTVSLLRGADGQLLITRKLPPVFESSSSSTSADDSSTPSILVTWIERDAHDGPPATSRCNVSYSLLLATNVAVEDDHAYDCHLMLVRNLNALDEPSSSSSASERASPKLSTVTVRGYRFGSVVGRDYGDNIRLLGCSIDDASFVSLRWDFGTNVMSVRPSPVASERPHVDSRAGVLLQSVQSQAYVMCSTYLETKFRSVEWLVDSSSSASAVSDSSPSLQSSCRYDLPTPNSRVTAMETLHCDASSLAVAVVVSSSATAESTSKSDTTILVLQFLVEDTMGLVVLSKPHVLYSIPLGTDVTRVELVATPSYPYWFLFKEWSRTDNHQWTAGYKRFNPPPTASQALARLKGLVERGQLDDAARILHGDGGSDRALLMDDEYSTFVPTEIPLQQLRAVLVQGEQANGLSSADLRSIQKYAQDLEDATSTGTDPHGAGFAHLLDAADLLADLTGSPTVAQVQEMLSIAQRLVGKEQFDDRRSAKQKYIQDQLDVVGYLSRLIEKGGAESKHVRLDGKFRSIRTIPQLFEALVEHRFFGLAELMWHQSADGQALLSPYVLVSAILKISHDAPPQAYSALLEDVVLPQLSINHPYLRTIRSWACRVADRLDEATSSDAGLDSAIHLLEVTERGTQALQLRLFSSFATDSPLIEISESRMSSNPSRLVASSGRRKILDAIPSNASLRSGSSPSKISGPSVPFMAHGDGSVSAPSLLSVGALRKGVARRGSNLKYQAPGDDDYDSNANCVREKLNDARCLRDARRAGLPRTSVTLKRLAFVGGADFIAAELLEIPKGSSYEEFLKETVAPFCLLYSVHFDAVILRCVESKSRKASPSSLTECARASRCCQSDAMKSRAALCVLRAVSRCGVFPDWVTSLSQHAIVWASSDSGLQSEVEEVTRLLRIDSIIVRYCGTEARGMFRIDNPHHSKRLLKHVTDHYGNESVLADSFALCDAFSHLSRTDAIDLILDQAIVNDLPDLCGQIIRSVFPQDRAVAEHGLVSALASVEAVLRESTSIDSHRAKAKSALACLLSIIAAMLEFTTEISTSALSRPNTIHRTTSLKTFKHMYEQVQRLQMLGVSASLSELSKPRFLLETASTIVYPAIAAYTSDQSRLTATKIAIAKKACSLLVVDPSRSQFRELWVNACCCAAVTLVEQHKDALLLDFMQLVGLFDEKESPIALLTIAKSLFGEASRGHDVGESYNCMVRVVNAAHLLQDRSLFGASGKVLLSVVTFGAIAGTACEMLRRCDEGIGESLDDRLRNLQLQSCEHLPLQSRETSIPSTLQQVQIPVRRPTLRPTWYSGDGLLLPPQQSMTNAIDFCVGALLGSKSSVPAFEFLRHNGSNFLTLRVLATIASSCSVSIVNQRQRHRQSIRREVGLAYSDAMTSLAERCLGGSRHIGLTSGTIDPQLGTAFLLSLPLKQAFSIYKDSLPSSFKSRNYSRSFMLALVGLVASWGSSGEAPEGFRRVGWQQTRFHEQCRTIAIQSRWLDRLQEHGVPFDAHGFDSVEQDASVGFATSLLPSVIEKLSVILDPPAVRRWYFEFCETFEVPLEVGLRAHVSWCLVPSESRDSVNLRKDQCNLEIFVRTLLNRLALAQRCDVLRRCVLDLEKSVNNGASYERFALVLALYHEELLSFASQETTSTSVFPHDIGSEIDLIDRRRDVLSILMSYFKGDKAARRPRFPAFFLPLHENSTSPGGTMGTRLCGVLGKYASGDVRGFDPLEALETLFAEEVDTSILTALAPLSVSVGLPQGYMHVRFLMARFVRSGLKPSFENDVTPTLRKLRKASDRVLVAEWCAMKYGCSDEDKLKCFEIALESALQASSELEARTIRDVTKEETALETVKRLSSEKSALLDILKTKTILREGKSCGGQISRIADALIVLLDSFVVDNRLPQPEQIIDFLLSKGSLLAAESSLDPLCPLSASQLRKLCFLIQGASKALVEHNSHIHFVRRCKRLANQWLYHGDGEGTAPSQAKLSEHDSVQPHGAELHLLDQEDTVNFEMNLDVFRDDDEGWVGQTTHGRSPSHNTSDEEYSSLLPVSNRELSESSSHRASIRIAFVLAASCDLENGIGSADEENTASHVNRLSTAQSLRSRLISKIETLHGSRQEQQAIEHSRDLLGIVFAKSISSIALCSSSSYDQLNDSSAASTPKILTFAMRHRALRAASILCPQEALERVAEEESLLCEGASKICTLKACTFGTFVAKEIEELGLSLPHSDLSRLSSMHYPSYARALRRDYRDSKRGEGRGRLLLLMLEMSLKGESSSDVVFMESLLDEMVQLHLPRTLLMATERLCGDASRRLSLQSILRGSSFRAALVLLSSSISSELRRVTEAVTVEAHVRKASSETLSRLGSIAVALRSIDTDWLDVARPDLTSLMPSLSDVELLESLRKVVLQLDRCVPLCLTDVATVDEFISGVLQRLEGTMMQKPKF